MKKWEIWYVDAAASQITDLVNVLANEDYALIELLGALCAVTGCTLGAMGPEAVNSDIMQKLTALIHSFAVEAD